MTYDLRYSSASLNSYKNIQVDIGNVCYLTHKLETAEAEDPICMSVYNFFLATVFAAIRVQLPVRLAVGKWSPIKDRRFPVATQVSFTT